VGKHYIGPVGRTTGSLSASLRKNAHLVGRIGSGVWVSSPSFQKNARLMGCLGSGPHLMADRADVVPANPNGVDWPRRSADRADVVLPTPLTNCFVTVAKYILETVVCIVYCDASDSVITANIIHRHTVCYGHFSQPGLLVLQPADTMHLTLPYACKYYCEHGLCC